MSEPDIFISYCREDRDWARRLSGALAQEGFDVWWDAQIQSGDTFDEVIEQHLRAAKAVVVLWSPRSVASRWVRAEATLADRANKLVPIIIEPCNLPIIFELTHAAELANWDGDTSDPRWQTLKRDLGRLTGQPRPVQTAPAHHPVAGPSAHANDARGHPLRPRQLHTVAPAIAPAVEPAAPELLKPTPTERAQADFYQRADEFRQREGELHCLLRLDGEELETRYEVTAAGLSLGRAAPADVIIPGLGVSRSHCLVELAADQLRVTDLNSTNGTYVDNKRIERSAPLPVGSVLRIGNVMFEHEVRPRTEFDELDAAGAARGPADRLSSVARH